MDNKNSVSIITIQILLSFILGVFGNKVSELFSIKPLYTIIIVLLLLTATFLISLPKETISRIQVKNFILNNIFLTVPLFFSIGFFVSMCIIKLFKSLNITASIGFTFYYNEADGMEFFIYLYEIFAYMVLAFLLWLYRKNNLNLYILSASLLGSTCGISTAILYFKPQDNTSMHTFFGGLFTCIFIISLIDFLNKFKLQVKKNP